MQLAAPGQVQPERINQEQWRMAIPRNRPTRPPPRAPALLCLTVIALAACRVDIEPPPADPPPPIAQPPAAIQVMVPISTVAPGEPIPVQATGFPGSTTVQIGFGQPRSDYSVVTEAQTDAQGRLDTTIDVPGWSMRGHPYVVVVTESEQAPTAVSEPFVVGRPGDPVRSPGTLTDEGVECPAMRGPEGTLYTLAVTDLEWGPGTEVMVEGTIAELAICMQGTTLEVTRIERR
jgi:hypothetical protein